MEPMIFVVPVANAVIAIVIIFGRQCNRSVEVDRTELIDLARRPYFASGNYTTSRFGTSPPAFYQSRRPRRNKDHVCHHPCL